MLTLFWFQLGFMLLASLSSWAAMIFLTSVFPIFKFKEEFVDYCIRTRGTPPSRRRLLLNVYGACNYFFMSEICNDLNVPNGLRIVPNSNYFHFFMVGVASFLTAVLFWIIALVVFVVVTAFI